MSYGAGAEQVADVYHGVGAGAGARPLVILVHGGYWRPQYDRAHLRPMAQGLAAAGWTVALPEYARLPGRPDAALADIRLAWQHLPALAHPHDGRVILAGHSAGGHLALCAAQTAAGPPAGALAGVLALAPVADLRLADDLDLDEAAVRAFLGAPADARPDLDPRRLPSAAAAVVVLQGDADTLVPQAVAESYAAAHPAARLVRLPGAGHFQPIDPLSAAWPVVLESLAGLAGQAAPAQSPPAPVTTTCAI